MYIFFSFGKNIQKKAFTGTYYMRDIEPDVVPLPSLTTTQQIIIYTINIIPELKHHNIYWYIITLAIILDFNIVSRYAG